MCQSIFLLAVIVLGLLKLPTFITADCTDRNHLVGIGYNLIFGNPDGDHNLGGRDPGLKYNYQILVLTYDEEKSVTIDGVDYCVPDQVNTVPLSSCSYVEETYFFSGTASYQDVFSSMVSVDASYDNGLSSYSFSGSSEYESVEQVSETTESVFYDKRAFCHESQSRYRIENIPSDDTYGVTTDFYNAFEALPDEKQSTISDDYYNFLTTWGTHILEENDMGGRRVQRYQSSLTDLYEYALESSSNSITLGGEYNGFSTSVSMDIDTLSESTTASTEFGSFYTVLTTGSTLEYNEDQEEWNIPDGDTNSPEPSQLYLISIATVCDNTGYWNTIDDLDDADVDSFLLNRCANLIAAIANYSTYLALSEPYDVSTLPITWPSGVYGLLQPNTDDDEVGEGCPQETSGFSFFSEWRQQYGRKKGKHEYSDNNHFEGHLGSSIVKYYFCMKNVEDANTDYAQSWPAGQYCIYKSPLGDCPDDGFEEPGYIKWNDREKGKNKRGKTSNGVLPAGSYKKEKTTIYYCCRDDGSKDEDIYLPSSEPFYLIRFGNGCQKVSGMTATEETMRINSQDKKTKHSGIIPYVEKNERYRMYYCYYEPK